MFDPNSLHIVLASDTNYAKLVSVLIVSVFDNNQDFDSITIHLLSNGISEKAISEIRKHIPDTKGELAIYDISNIKTLLKVTPPETISISAYSRLFVGSILPDTIDKVIYMDVDGIVTGSLWELWNTDINSFHIAGCLDDVEKYAKKAIGLDLSDAYINSGFLAVNLKKWRKDNIEQKFIDFLVGHNGNVYHHDQGLINAVCKKIYILPPNYNMVTNFFIFPFSNFKQTPFYTKEELQNGTNNPIYIHFTAGVAGRPWMRNCKHPKKELYIKYLQQTTYNGKPLDKDCRPIRLKLLSLLYFNCKPLYKVVLLIRSYAKHQIA